MPAPSVPAPSPDRDGIASALLSWFGEHGRPLSIRASRDPWAILVTEVMSQQTQIGRVEERLPAFLAAFPSASDLAPAQTTDLLRAWAGLGYNRRAVALRQTARTIVALHGGRVPGDVATLESLPGVGPYTARAVAARAFGQPVAALDVNVRRVIGRMLPPPPPGRTRSPAELQAQADLVVDRARPGQWNDAVIDLAASVCGPREPDCPGCPVRLWCATGTSRREAGEAPASAAHDADGRGQGRGAPMPPGPSRGTDVIPFPLTRR